jgi:hypothetical protein
VATKVLSGGDKLNAALKGIADRVGREGVVRIGFLENSTYPDGTSVPMIAAINEFGAPSRGQPPRPFFRRMIASKSGEWPAAIGKNLIATNYDVETTLKRMGAGIAGQLRQSIIDLVAPPLAPSTIKRKGFDKPLIDQGIMLSSVDYEVETK